MLKSQDDSNGMESYTTLPLQTTLYDRKINNFLGANSRYYFFQTNHRFLPFMCPVITAYHVWPSFDHGTSKGLKLLGLFKKTKHTQITTDFFYDTK